MTSWQTLLTSLYSDAIYAWRRLAQTKVVSAAGILSLALAAGACITSFRLIDALLLRPLPVANAERLFVMGFRSPSALDGRLLTYDSNSHPAFERMKQTVQDQARLTAVSYVERADITYKSDEEMEKAFTQFVSGDMFTIFGLKPAAGRLLDASDDLKPGAHPVAVISYDYWNTRFSHDPQAVGRTVRLGETIYQIIGVSPAGFTGTETGASVDIFIPMMMKNPATLASWNNFWLRILIQLRPGASPARLRERLAAVYHTIELERSASSTLTPTQRNELFNETVVVEPAAAGRSNLQRDYRDSLLALAILVALVLLIATANLANLMTARAVARSREMAIRVSLGAGRARLITLVWMESAWIAGLASLGGMLLSSWATPFLVGMLNSPENPIRLSLGFDFRLVGFSVCLCALLTLLFGFPPALRASGASPSLALRGDGRRYRRRLMHALSMTQVAFCFAVLLIAGLFVRSLDRLSHEPLGYSPARIVNLESVTHRAQPPVYWEQTADRLRAFPGVEGVTLAAWPLMNGETANSAIAVHGALSEVFADRFMVSGGWFEEMKVPLLGGRDFRASEARPGPAIVNEAFVRQYFPNEIPLGKPFDVADGRGGGTPMQIVGVVANSRYRDNLRIPIRPTFYVPFRAEAKGQPQPVGRGTFVVRTAPGVNPLSLAPLLRREVSLARPEIRVSNIRTQEEIVESKTVRERLLSTLALFFAAVAAALAAVGLYGVLDYSVLQRRREIGIRIALGARNRHIIEEVTLATFGVVALGAALGLGGGIVSVRYIQSILYRVNAGDPAILLIPTLIIAAGSVGAAIPAILRARRINPVEMLRAD
jgi:predicted permease